MPVDLPDKCIIRQPGVAHTKYNTRGGEWSVKRTLDLMKFTSLTLIFLRLCASCSLNFFIKMSHSLTLSCKAKKVLNYLLFVNFCCPFLQMTSECLRT